MDQIKTRVRVTEDHTFAGPAPADLPAGEHDVVIMITPKPELRPSELPVHPGRWDDRISLRREDMYDDLGR